MTTAMQKWEIAAPGDANLRMVTASKPLPKPGEILIEVDAVSLNYRERWIIDGGMGGSWEKPLTPGSDVARRGGEHAARGGTDSLDGLGRARQAPGRTDGGRPGHGRRRAVCGPVRGCDG